MLRYPLAGLWPRPFRLHSWASALVVVAGISFEGATVRVTVHLGSGLSDAQLRGFPLPGHSAFRPLSEPQKRTLGISRGGNFQEPTPGGPKGPFLRFKELQRRPLDSVRGSEYTPPRGAERPPPSSPGSGGATGDHERLRPVGRTCQGRRGSFLPSLAVVYTAAMASETNTAPRSGRRVKVTFIGTSTTSKVFNLGRGKFFAIHWRNDGVEDAGTVLSATATLQIRGLPRRFLDDGKTPLASNPTTPGLSVAVVLGEIAVVTDAAEVMTLASIDLCEIEVTVGGNQTGSFYIVVDR